MTKWTKKIKLLHVIIGLINKGKIQNGLKSYGLIESSISSSVSREQILIHNLDKLIYSLIQL